jgi:hypothetical protein
MSIRVHSKSGRFIALLPESLTGGFAVVATRNGVDSFRSSWPCSRLPDRPLRFEFAPNGDLVDLNTNYDGPDILALSQDAQEFGEKALRFKQPKKGAYYLLGNSYDVLMY